MIIANLRYVLVGYSITSYPMRAHGIIVIYYNYWYYYCYYYYSIIIIVPKNVYEQMRVRIFFVFFTEVLKDFFSLKRVCKYIFNHDI